MDVLILSRLYPKTRRTKGYVYVVGNESVGHVMVSRLRPRHTQGKTQVPDVSVLNGGNEMKRCTNLTQYVLV